MKALLFSLACAVVSSAQTQAQTSLKQIQTIPLPGVTGRFDHFAMDVKGQRLFVAALGNNTLEVLDLNAGKRAQSIAGLHKPTGVLFLPESNRIVVANGDDGTVKFFNGASYQLVASLGSLDDADNLRYDAKSKLIYVGYGDGGIGIIDSATAKQIDSLKLPAHPESFQLEGDGPRIFVNVPDAEQVAVIDRERRTVIAAWPMKDFKANFPMALDEASHRLFIGCRKPPRLLVMDSANGKKVTDIPISGDTDDLFYDAKSKRVYVSCGEGFIDVIDERDANLYQPRERIATSPGARTSFYSSDLGQLYLAVPLHGNQTAGIRVFEVSR